MLGDERIFGGKKRRGSAEMCGLISLILKEIYAWRADSLKSFWHTCCERRCAVNEKDAFFMTRVTMKHGGTRDFMAIMLRMKGQMFERMVMSVINNTSSSFF